MIIIVIILFISTTLFGGNEIFLFNDVNDGKVFKNNLGHPSSSFQSGGGECILAPENNYANVYGRFGYSLRLDYDVRAQNCFAGYWSMMKDYDLSRYNYLSFWVKGKTGKEFFKVQLKVKDSADNIEKSAVYINDFIHGGLSSEWKKAVIPLDAFMNISNRTKVDEFVIVFENYQSSINQSILKSSIYIDNIIFGTKFLEYIPIDCFGDMFGPLAVGGNTGAGGGSDGAVTNSISEQYYCSEPYSLRLAYDVSAGDSYAYYFMILGGGENGETKKDNDLSDYDKFSFNIKAESLDKNPHGITIELHDFSGIGTGEPFYKINKTNADRIQTYWQQFNIALSDFADGSSIKLNKSKIQEAVITFENSNVSNASGVVYVDDLMFITETYDPNPASPSYPYNLQDNGVTLKDDFTLTLASKLTVNADSSETEPFLECIRFELSSDDENWQIIKTDYDLSDNNYEVDLNPDNFLEDKAYLLRVGAENIYGNITYLGPYKSIKFSKTDYSDKRAGKLIKEIQVINNPFSPDKDGIKDEAVFYFKLSHESEVLLKVLDIAGNHIYTSENSTFSADMLNSITWNGKNKNNETVKNGVYFYKLSARGSNGKDDQIIQVIGVIK